MPVRVERVAGTAFLAFPEMVALLTSELSGRFGYGAVAPALTVDGTAFSVDTARWYGDLLYCPDFSVQTDADGSPVTPYWSRTTLIEPFLLRFDSIGEAANALRGIQRNWAPYQYTCFRRAALVQERLPHFSLRARTFPAEIPHSPMGIFTLLDAHTILASARTSSALPAGTLRFEEDHEGPPSRAYLKLQEALVMARHMFGTAFPGAGQKCFEAGASPGGWTWVLRQLGAEVLAVDRAELAPALMADAHVSFVAHDAFTLAPQDVCARLRCETVDWVLSDVICYPERLYEWVQTWLASGRARNMLCTIKMQGAIDWSLVARFAALPRSRVLHLNYNKHELTWIHAG